MRKYLIVGFGLIRLLKESIINGDKLQLHGIKYSIGSKVKFWLHNGGVCDIGEKTWLSDFCSFESNGGQIKLGKNNFFNNNCKLVSIKKITIGDNNLFGPNVTVVDHKHNYEASNELICKQGFSSAPVVLGSDIWICANVVITQGVTIVDHVVVAANSVVNKNLLVPGVYAGSPAKLIRESINKYE